MKVNNFFILIAVCRLVIIPLQNEKDEVSYFYLNTN